MIKLLSHLSYVAITSPDVEASVRFYEEQVGLTVVDRIDGVVYLRCWGDYYAYSVVVVPGDEPSLETMAWRTSSAEALEEAANRIEAAGAQGEWIENVPHIGRAYRFIGPFGHSMTLHWDVTRHQAPTESALMVAAQWSLPMWAMRTGGRSCPSGPVRTTAARTMPRPSPNTLARTVSSSSGTALTGNRPPSIWGRTPITGTRVTMNKR